MSLQSAKHFENIVMYLSVLRYMVKSNSKRGYFDLNKSAEPFFKALLNLIFGWNLKNLNETQANYPAIDLGDADKGICVQVTAESNSSKIKKTISKLVEKEYFKTYPRLIVLIITDKLNYSTTFDTAKKFTFNRGKDILDVDDLLAAIELLPFNVRESIHDFLASELRVVISAIAPPDSLLALAEKNADLPPKNGRALLVGHMRYEDEHMQQGFSDLLRFYQGLEALPRTTREYLWYFVEHGKQQGRWRLNAIEIQPAQLEGKLKLSKQRNIEHFQLLGQLLVADYDDSEPPHVFQIRFDMDTGVELLGCLKEFARTPERLKQILVECDFTALDDREIA